jgi:hypothetical protein
MPLKLTDEQVLVIRRRAAEGEARRDLALQFGVAVETISRIIRGDSRAAALTRGAPEFTGELSPQAIAESERRLAALQVETRRPAGEVKQTSTNSTIALSPTMAWLLEGE